MNINVLSIFSGGGGLDLGFKQAGADAVKIAKVEMKHL